MKPQQYWFLRAAAFAVALLLSQQSGALTFEAGVDSTDTAYPVVITPTRLRQSLADVPASVTVITAETLRRYGVANIEGALRLVPGMVVLKATGNDYRIGYHGTHAVNPRRLNVLVDGVSVYRPALSRVDWAMLPVAMEDVDRIEVIRGPDSAAYGPNSMMAVINILTKHPGDVERGLVSVSAGAHHTLDTTLRLAKTLGPTSLRATVDTQRDSGYDQMSLKGGAHDSTQLKRLNLRAQTDLSGGASLDLQASYVEGVFGSGYIDPFETTYPDARKRDMQVSGKWTKALSATHELQVNAFSARAEARQSWTTCWPQAVFVPEIGRLAQTYPEYAAPVVAFITTGQLPPGFTFDDAFGTFLTQVETALNSTVGLAAAGRPACGQGHQDAVETRTQLEIQDTFVASNDLRLVGGLGMRYQRAQSETYFAGAVGNSVRWAFGHAEYRPTSWLTTNVGGYSETNSLSGSTFSPRLAANLHLSDSQTVRAVFSKGTRSPDIFEERANWSYTVRGLTPPVVGATTVHVPIAFIGRGNIVSERISSRELGYLLALPRGGLTIDAKVFDDRLTQLVPTYTPADLGNRGAVRLTGAETQVNWEFAPGWSSLLNYAYLLNRDAVDPAETMLYARNSGAIGISRALSRTWFASLAYYGSGGDGLPQSRYGRTDLNVSHAFNLGDLPASASALLSYLDSPSAKTYVADFMSSNRAVVSQYDNRLSLRATLRVAF